LLEFLLPNFLQVDPDYIAPVHPRIAVVGRPNVGKSTLINILIGEERVVVSHQPGTTRDSVDTLVTYKGQSYVFTDTAGIRRRGKIDRGIEGYSVARALRALGRSDVAVLMLDGVEGVTEQDTKIAGLIQKQGRGCLILVNKWDLQIRKHKSQAEYMCELKRLFPFLSFVPIVFGSAITPQTIGKIFPHIDTVMAEFSKRIPTGQLNQFLQRALEKNPIPMRRAQPMKSVYFTQVAIKPPTFVLFVKRPEDIPLTYFRYLENALRDNYGFVGTPIRILTRGK
jgi:GTP-binding protein